MQPQKFGSEDDVTPAEMDTIVNRVLAGMDHRLCRIVAYLVGMAPSGNMYISDTWDIPKEGPFPAATDAWSFFNDPRAITIEEITKSLQLIYRGDTDAAGQAKPPGQNTHPANIEFIYKAVDTVETSQAEFKTAIAALPKEIPPLSDAQIEAIAAKLSAIHPQAELKVELTGTAQAQATPPPAGISEDYADSAE
jgi:hypothetical protein